MTIRDTPEYDDNYSILMELISKRGNPRRELDQKYLDIDSILTKIDFLHSSSMINGKRILCIGDADLSGLATAIFGSPKEVVVADIDERLSEIYFESTLEYDLPSRYLYHDMRIKIIEVLLNQYSPVLIEPPRTKAGIEVFISRAIQCLEKDTPDGIFVIIPSEGVIRDYFNGYLSENNITIKKLDKGVINYQENYSAGDLIQLQIHDNTTISHKYHWLDPFYEDEVKEKIYKYKCICEQIIYVGKGGDYENKAELEIYGCTECDHDGVFAYQSEIELR